MNWMNEKRNIEFEEPRLERGSQFSFRNLMDGNVLNQRFVRKQIPYLIMLVLISLLMIANRNHAEKLVIETNSMQNELKELRSRSITTSANLVKMSSQTKVEQMVRERGLDLEENKEPIKKLTRKPNE